MRPSGYAGRIPGWIWRSRIWTVCLTAGLLLGQTKLGQTKEVPQTRRPIMTLASDLVPYISHPEAALILATVDSARWAPASDDPGMEDGTLQLRVNELFSDSGPKPGALLTVGAQRYGDAQKRRQM